MAAWPSGEADRRQLVAEALDTILRLGLRPAKLSAAPETFILAAILGSSGGDGTDLDQAVAVDQGLRALLDEVFADGQAGEALRLLLGACPASRSLPLKSRRRLAAEHLELQVATFLKNYEADLLDDVAVEVLRRWTDTLRETASVA